MWRTFLWTLKMIPIPLMARLRYIRGCLESQLPWYARYTDGAVIGGLNDFSLTDEITITLNSSRGIDDWYFLTGDPANPDRILLDMSKTLVFTTRPLPLPRRNRQASSCWAPDSSVWEQYRGGGEELACLSSLSCTSNIIPATSGDFFHPYNSIYSPSFPWHSPASSANQSTPQLADIARSRRRRGNPPAPPKLPRVSPRTSLSQKWKPLSHPQITGLCNYCIANANNPICIDFFFRPTLARLLLLEGTAT